jgi:DNA-binding Lrp family transcriptional regulator
LDQTDRALLARLSGDARVSIARLAEAVGVSRATAYKRIEALTADGTIREYATVLDDRAVGLEVTALVMARVDQTDWRAAREAIEALPAVKYAALVTGDLDLLMIVQAADIDHLRDVVLRELNGLPSVRTTRTLLVLDEFVDRVNPPVPLVLDPTASSA